MGVVLLDESFYYLPVATRFAKRLVLSFVESMLLIGSAYAVFTHQSSSICADCIYNAAVRFLKYCCRHMPVVLLSPFASCFAIGGDGHGCGVGISLHSSVSIASAHPHLQIAVSGLKRSASFCICFYSMQGIKLRIVVESEIYGGILDGRSVLVHHFHVECLDWSVCCSGRDAVAFIVECPYQHGTTCRPVEPSFVERGFRFACSQESPFAINPHLYPCMVVVGVCPSWAIYLSCRDAHATHGRHSEGALFATAPYAVAHGSQWCSGSAVAWSVAYFLVTPVVDFECRLFHGHSFQSWHQFFINSGTCFIECFVVDTHGQYEVLKFP